jgi:hypothetical protein
VYGYSKYIIIIIIISSSSSSSSIGKDTISFMQGIYTYIPETNHVLKEYDVAIIIIIIIIIIIVPVVVFSSLRNALLKCRTFIDLLSFKHKLWDL